MSKLEYEVNHEELAEILSKVKQENAEFIASGGKYADERTEKSWAITRTVELITSLLPPETNPLNVKPITFEEEDLDKGLNAIFQAGTVMPSDREGVLIVPQRSLEVLRILNIPYQAVGL